jgi:hypothetical protein
MSKSLKTLLLALILALPAVSHSFAQAPSGVYTNLITPDIAPVYDLTGSYVLDQNVIGLGGTSVELTFQINLNQTVQGRLMNVDNVTLVGIGNSTVGGRYNVSGHVLTTKGETHAKFNVHIHNTDVVAGVKSAFNINMRYDFILSPGSSNSPATMSGFAQGNANFAGFGNGKVDTTQNLPLSLPAPMDGSWLLTMNLLPLGHLSGTGSVTLSNGRALQMRLHGSFSDSTGLSKVNLTGIQGSQGNTLHVEFATGDTNSGNSVQIQTLKGHLFGQQVLQ